ncbi:hypothetical protein D0Z07_1502 [Hyphodiscus hymeniophilus]|uniref:BZIP domain-containing protein n=1 Tax=Hyphodiscus hymeniophilus TaxID=353542 RepID=A0A9P7AZJ7_9HELO|nr:hypothetical protein D0Z07_1502 [Hyphodiscus hymeniophilus]
MADSDSSRTYRATASEWPSNIGPGSLGNLTATRIRADGQPMKKRGPKPRNQPTLTRQQELARKAQRNHRERKEFYVKALEQEVLQLKDDVVILSSRNDSLEEENGQLKRLLRQFSTASSDTWEASEISGDLTIPYSFNPDVPYGHGTRVDGSSRQVDPADKTTSPSPPPTQASIRHQLHRQNNSEIDYDQAGIDFVLELERPCLMKHMRVEPENELYGHALMVSCSPGQYLEPNTATEIGQDSAGFPSQQTCYLNKRRLANLLERSRSLDLGGEVTPVMAWDMILNHPRHLELHLEDFKEMCRILKGKVKCYGFGAVFEEFEVRDVIENIMSTKYEVGIETT